MGLHGPPMLKGWAPLVRYPSPSGVAARSLSMRRRSDARYDARGGLLVTCGGGLFTGGFTGGQVSISIRRTAEHPLTQRHERQGDDHIGKFDGLAVRLRRLRRLGRRSLQQGIHQVTQVAALGRQREGWCAQHGARRPDDEARAPELHQEELNGSAQRARALALLARPKRLEETLDGVASFG